MYDPISAQFVQTLDVSNWNEQGQQLIDRIIKEVTPDSLIFTIPPSILELRSDQFQSIQDKDELEWAQEYSELTNEIKLSKEKLFYVYHPGEVLPTVVMEVRIKGGDYAAEAPKSN